MRRELQSLASGPKRNFSADSIMPPSPIRPLALMLLADIVLARVCEKRALVDKRVNKLSEHRPHGGSAFIVTDGPEGLSCHIQG